MKKVLAVLLTLCLLMSLTACGSSTTPTTTAAPTTTEAPATQAPTTQAPTEAPTEVPTEAPQPEAEPYIDLPEQYRSWDANGNPVNYEKYATAENGMVAALRYEPAEIGKRIMEQGGTAIDAAVAVALALTVTMPHMCSIAGGGIMTFYNAEQDKVVFLSFREVAPQFQTAELWVEDGEGNVIGSHKSVGGLACGVPGEVAGLYYALKTYGTMEWADVVQPSIDLAREGFIMTPELREGVNYAYNVFANNPELSEIYLDEDGLVIEAGQLVKNEYLAKAYETLRDQGRDAVYGGVLGEAIVKAAQATGGVMTMADLEAYDCWEDTPATGTYKGYTVYSSNSPSSGGTFIIQMLNMMEELPVQEHGSVEYYHQIHEVEALAFADRAEYMADTRFVDVPLDGLMSKEYAQERVKALDMTKPQIYTYGNAWDYETESQNTTNFVVADKAGNMVALTHTINGFWGSHDYVQGCGFFLNNQLDDFVQGTGYSNSLEPGKCPMSSMSPTVVFDPDGNPFMTVGAPGGFMIYQGVFQAIINAIDYGMNADEAVNTGRVAVLGSTTFYSPEDVPEDVLNGLKALGYEEFATYNAIGFPVAIMYKDGKLEGGAEDHSSISLYSDGVAIGY